MSRKLKRANKQLISSGRRLFDDNDLSINSNQFEVSTSQFFPIVSQSFENQMLWEENESNFSEINFLENDSSQLDQLNIYDEFTCDPAVESEILRMKKSLCLEENDLILDNLDNLAEKIIN